MSATRRPPLWAAALLGAIALAVLYARPLATGFLNDDFLFLEEARRTPLVQSLGGLDPLGNYYRPLSRALYFETLAPIAGGHPAVFHAINFAVWLAALALLFDLLRVFAPFPAAMAGTLVFALLPFQRVNLTWISCSQDLLALAGSLAALALWRRGRTRWAAFAALLAFASKESALPLAGALIAWDLLIERRAFREALRRAAPVLIVTAAWLLVVAMVRSTHPGLGWSLQLSAAGFVSAPIHAALAILGLDHPPGFFAALFASGPDPLALVLTAALAFWIAGAAGATPANAAAIRFAIAWLALFVIPLGPVAHTWSGYYATLAAVGAALLAAIAMRTLGRVGWVILCAALLWWHAGATSVRAFAVDENPWRWTSHLTTFYFERAAALTDTMSRQLRRLEPAPEPGKRFFFVDLPSHAGFQMGNGALIRALYRDTTLESHFYSQFGESTAAGRAFRVLRWDGREFRDLYGGARDPMFQMGVDLLLLDQPGGAVHAFRRGLSQGESRDDHLYALGWAELWRGRRDLAEDAWTQLGARDDSVKWHHTLRLAQTAWIEHRNSPVVRRILLEAIGYGIGRPEAHATLGRLLLPVNPKYALLELKIAAWLDPRDIPTRVTLAEGLLAAYLDNAARRELDALAAQPLPAGADTTIARLRARLGASSGGVVAY